jgi:hypothetical protein
MAGADLFWIAMLSKNCQTGRHPNAARGLDLYETPPAAVEALLRVEKLPHHIWEPAAGRGAIVRVLRDHGHAVIASDIRDYGFPLHIISDFRAQTKAPAHVECICTNPPFNIVQPFVEHALNLVPRVIVLARLALLESVRRTVLLEHRGLARVHVFRRRLPMMHRDNWAGRTSTSSIPFAWFTWYRDHAGPTVVDRISWEKSADGGVP